MIDSTNGVRLADLPKIGDYWTGQGGIYAGIVPDYDGTEPRALVVAVDEAADIWWGGMGSSETGAHSRDDGAANTRDLLACTQHAHIHHAARFASAYEKDGHKDFYLPSRRELDVAYETVRDKFDPTDLYWSSSEYSYSMVWGRSFGEFELKRLFKIMPGRARPVRSMPIVEDASTVGPAHGTSAADTAPRPGQRA